MYCILPISLYNSLRHTKEIKINHGVAFPGVGIKRFKNRGKALAHEQLIPCTMHNGYI